MNIVQFSPGRSGSTLVWNILKELFENENIHKCHRIKYDVNQKIVSTVRDPRDILASRLLIGNNEINEVIIKKNLDEMKRYGFDDLIKIKNKSNVLILKYELFYNNYDYIFDELEQFFGITISLEKRNEIKQKFEIKEVMKISSKLGSFKKYDKDTHIHGKHISEYKGKPNNWKNIIPKEYHEMVKNALQRYVELFLY